MEIKIGIQHVNREVVVESELSSDEAHALVTKAIASGEVLALDDEKGRRVIVPSASIGYVDIGEENARRVGFGSV